MSNPTELIGKTARFYYVSDHLDPSKKCVWHCKYHFKGFIEAKVLRILGNHGDPVLTFINPLDKRHRIRQSLSDVQILKK